MKTVDRISKIRWVQWQLANNLQIEVHEGEIWDKLVSLCGSESKAELELEEIMDDPIAIRSFAENFKRRVTLPGQYPPIPVYQVPHPNPVRKPTLTWTETFLWAAIILFCGYLLGRWYDSDSF